MEGFAVDELMEEKESLGCCVRFVRVHIKVAKGSLLDNSPKGFMNTLSDHMKDCDGINNFKAIPEHVKVKTLCRRNPKTVTRRSECMHFFYYTECA